MKPRSLFIFCFSAPIVLTICAVTAHSEVFTYTDETTYLNALQLSNHTIFTEDFEFPDWGVIAALTDAGISTYSHISHSIEWTSNHPNTNPINVSSEAAVTGSYGLYDPDHGYATGTPEQCNIVNPPIQCLLHDGVSGTRVVGAISLVGAGGWFHGSPGASVAVSLDGGAEISLGMLPDSGIYFYGVIDTDLFASFSFRDIGGRIGNELYIFADDFTFGVPISVCTPTGNPETTCDGIDDDCDGQVDEDYTSDTSCGVGQCLLTSTPSSCFNGVETLCKPGIPFPENSLIPCRDGFDNDCDGLVDGADPDCPVCIPVSNVDTTCDGVDDDCDGRVDDDYIRDASCGVGQCLTNNTPSSCFNGVETLCKPGPPFPENSALTCTDNADNDCDGKVDDADPGCQPCTPVSNVDTTCDGIDDDCNGRVDDGCSGSTFPWNMFLPAIIGTSATQR